MDVEVIYKEGLTEQELDILDAGINRHSANLFGEVPRGSLGYFLQDAGGETVGGVTGYWSAHGWLYINSLWVAEALRGSGQGTSLMRLIEEEAVSKGCNHVFLFTMSYQAPEFYKRLGYTQFAELEDFPRGHSRLFFRKYLLPPK
jgi:ribosomal protein S18 acetylase RimI-like enzyme